MRGRKPKPTARKILEGNPSRRPLPMNEPLIAVAPTFDVPPAEFESDPVACAEWSRLAPLLRTARVVTDADRGALLALCQCWSRYLLATKRIADAGMVITSHTGYPMPNPYISIANKALSHCTKLWAELGLTPSARSRVSTTGDGPVRNPFTEFDDQAPTRSH